MATLPGFCSWGERAKLEGPVLWWNLSFLHCLLCRGAALPASGSLRIFGKLIRAQSSSHRKIIASCVGTAFRHRFPMQWCCALAPQPTQDSDAIAAARDVRPQPCRAASSYGLPLAAGSLLAGSCSPLILNGVQMPGSCPQVGMTPEYLPAPELPGTTWFL